MLVLSGEEFLSKDDGARESYPLSGVDGGLADGLRQMGLAGAARPQEDDVLPGSHELSRSQMDDLLLGDRWHEREVELLEGLALREAGLRE